MITWRKIIAFSAVAALLLSSCNTDKKDTPAQEVQTVEENAAPTAINYGVVAAHPHDTTAFTEGLLVHEGKLFESTGSPEDMAQTRSLIGVVDLKTGKITPKAELDRKKYFGEGMVILKDKVYQLTYTTKVGFIYDVKTFKKLGEFTFPSQEGWGMTTDGTYLIMSDGTSNITYLDPNTFKPVKVVGVYDQNGPVININELEFINGFLYANIYTTNFIIKINPETGQVVGKIDLTSLDTEAKRKYPNAMELNGIAYDSIANKIYVTGKMWPNIYEIKFKI